MANDRYNRKLSVGDNVIFSERDAGIHVASGLTYGRITDINNNEICIDDSLWLISSKVEKK